MDDIFKHSKDDVSIDLWTYIDARKVLQGVLEPGVVIPDFSELNSRYKTVQKKEVLPVSKPLPPRKPTIQENVKKMREIKSALMKQIIETKDEKILEDMKRMFSSYEVRYMRDRLAKTSVTQVVDQMGG